MFLAAQRCGPESNRGCLDPRYLVAKGFVAAQGALRSSTYRVVTVANENKIYIYIYFQDSGRYYARQFQSLGKRLFSNFEVAKLQSHISFRVLCNSHH